MSRISRKLKHFVLVSVIVTIFPALNSCCTIRGSDCYTVSIPGDGQWHTVHGNHWSDAHTQRLIVKNVSSIEASQGERSIRLSQLEPDNLPSLSDPDSSDSGGVLTSRDSGPWEFSARGARRYVTLIGGWRILARSTAGELNLEVRLQQPESSPETPTN